MYSVLYNNDLNKSNEEIVVINTFKSINNYLCRLPIALSGLALAIVSLAGAWDVFIGAGGGVQFIGTVIASVLLILLLVKFILNLALLKRDLAHVIAGSVAPTYTMAMMLIGDNISLYAFKVGETICYLAILLHVYFFVCFIFYRIKDFRLVDVLPSWFIPPIGLVLAVITHPGGLPSSFASLLIYFAFIAYAILLPLVLYRLFFMGALANGEKPLFAILAAPPSLLLISYLYWVEQANYLMVWGLLMLAILMTLFVYLRLIKLVKLAFIPAFSAFTFPVVISAIALFKASAFLLHQGASPQLVSLTSYLAVFELVIATCIVAYVAFRYAVHFWPVHHQQ